MRHQNHLNPRLALPIILLAALAGCQKPAATLKTSDHRLQPGRNLARVDIPAPELEAGLNALFDQLAQQLGPYPYQPAIKNYLPTLRQGLYYHGYAIIEHLDYNSHTIDIVIAFRVDRQPAALTIQAFHDGRDAPLISLQNPYYLSETTAAPPTQSPIITSAPITMTTTNRPH